LVALETGASTLKPTSELVPRTSEHRDDSGISMLQSLATHALASETTTRCETMLAVRVTPVLKRKRPHSSEDDDSSTANEGELDDDFTDDLSEEEFASPNKKPKMAPKIGKESDLAHLVSESLVSSSVSIESDGLPINAVVTDSTDTMARRGHLPERAIRHLKGWFYAHRTHPYPSEEEKNVLMEYTGLSKGQINNWFTNARRRLLPKLESR